jgi:hypothetical protein
VGALQLGQLQRAVHAGHLQRIAMRWPTTGTPSATAMATMSVR